MRSPSHVLAPLVLLLVSVAALHAKLDLTVRKTHGPATFSRGGSGTYTIIVSNGSPPPKKKKDGTPTSAGITVIDTLPAGLTSKGASGKDWICIGSQVVTCTTAQTVAEGSSATAITLTVNVAPNAPTTVTNTVLVQGGGELPAEAGNNAGSDNTPISATVSITTASLPEGTVGVGYNQALAVSGGQPPYTWNLASGSLGSLTLHPSGAIAGTPSNAGQLRFTVRVTDSLGVADEKALSIDIKPSALLITTVSPLQAATLGSIYQQVFEASGGTPPYQAWNVTTGQLPAGLTLRSDNGFLSGTPTVPGQFAFTVTVRDNAQQSSSKLFRLLVPQPTEKLRILTTSCPPAPVDVNYSCLLQASGGVPEYTWSLGSGQLPPGLSLQPKTGLITGTPTSVGASAIGIIVRDKVSAVGTQTMTITVTSDASGTLSIVDDPAPGGQNQVTLVLSREFSQAVTGEIALTFTPHAALPGNTDDPAIQFSTGGRTVAFTVPPGSTGAQFSGGSLRLQLGTVAGTIKLTLTKMQAGSTDVTPSPAPTREIVVNRLAPTIRSVRIANRTSTGFTVEVVGFATSREITQALFQFNAAPGGTLAAGQATIQLNQLAQNWYQTQASREFGSQFVYAQPFTVGGNVSAIASLAVTLSNSLGNSAAMSASF